jgi:hypothetical protein
LVFQLALSFSRHLGIRPSHSVDHQTGKSTSLFDIFVRRAFMAFSPGDPSIPDAALREATRVVVAHWDDEMDEENERVYGLPRKLRKRSAQTRT